MPEKPRPTTSSTALSSRPSDSHDQHAAELLPLTETSRREIPRVGASSGPPAGSCAAPVVDDGYRPRPLPRHRHRRSADRRRHVVHARVMKNCCVINVEFYTGVDERLDVPVILPPTPRRRRPQRRAPADRRRRRRHRRDVRTSSRETVRPQVQELRTAVLYEKTRSIVKCDYVWRRTDDWIMFPWSSLPPVPGRWPTSHRAPTAPERRRDMLSTP